jgi:hypothetical protein
MRRCALAVGSLGLVALSVLPARAADTALAGSSEVAGGYSYVYASSGVSGVSGTAIPAGWFFSAGANISDTFSVVGDISGNYKSESTSFAGVTVTTSANVHTFLGGPRVQGGSGSISFYGQFLVGAATGSGGTAVSAGGITQTGSASDTEFCLAPGAGVNFSLGERSALRAGVSERLIRANTTTTTSTQPTFEKEFQLQIGLVYRFGI